ncbi:MAG: heavy-metal-associated domain-containing protein [Reinekea forsetii]|jgi:copper chaperone CopZ|uniref:Protein containng heavy-metal-associated domain protein n=1 Tax=Reinekea forsetii TaxID=1336806 RepID=A0A2K8KUB2_9GAMM|nr:MULTISPECIES: heavy metal-associated domain-containing protein [Reinekea]ATX78202.1 protein containng heavy-metal-associated domain protein [Reinekea forsetii]MDO7641821.1 heavy-metal-associated domain-containing protein [Reinekea forsetii]MDO7643888.1 heavy-metal-associated domain-containing protein [Reinekea forsetii]MDO7674970.1 heavy-metal-associated domain-containing protein [Reinekea forsetii]|tara:strand:+ start:348 stop:539 length:192 start_codon:yes stop_codon:yes gene_type:complete
MIELTVSGATCQGCVKSIEKAVSLVDGVTSVHFDLDSGIAQIDGNDNIEQLTDAIEAAGFEVP